MRISLYNRFVFRARNKVLATSQSGFTLMEVLVAGGIMSIILYIAASGLSGAFKQQSNLISKDNAGQFVRALSSYINNQSMCTGELRGLRFPVNGQMPLTLRNYKDFGETGAPIKTGSQLTDNIRVDELTLAHKVSVPVQTVSSGTSRQKVYVAQIRVRVSVGSHGKASRTSMKPSYIEFPVIVDSANKIVGCQVGFSVSTACEALGMSFNSATQQCVPETTCIVTGTYVETKCTPSKYGCDSTYNTNNSVTGKQSCPDKSSPRLTGELIYNTTVSCGKKCTADVQNQTKFYLCMQCE